MSDQRTMKIQTKCHECIFATFNNNKQQLGCELGRSEKFSAQGKTKTTNIRGTKALEISTVCNTYRDKEWEEAWHEHNDVQSNWQHPKDDVRNFVTCKVDFVIVENTDDDIDKVEEKFMITLESIIRHDLSLIHI